MGFCGRILPADSWLDKINSKGWVNDLSPILFHLLMALGEP